MAENLHFWAYSTTLHCHRYCFTHKAFDVPLCLIFQQRAHAGKQLRLRVSLVLQLPIKEKENQVKSIKFYPGNRFKMGNFNAGCLRHIGIAVERHWHIQWWRHHFRQPDLLRPTRSTCQGCQMGPRHGHKDNCIIGAKITIEKLQATVYTKICSSQKLLSTCTQMSQFIILKGD